MLQEITNHALIALIVSAIWAPILIWLLYRFNLVVAVKLLKDKTNAEFVKIHGHKFGTPRSGGLIITIPLYVLGLILLPASDLKMIYLIGVTLFTAYGLADDLITSGRKLSDKFKMFVDSFSWRVAKLLILFFIVYSLIFMLIEVAGIEQIMLWQNMQFLSGIGLESLTVDLLAPVMIGDFSLGNFPIIALISFLIMTALYAIEITDGADGLVTGQFLILFVVFGIIIASLASIQLAPILGILLGASIVYLYFNINPARVFMGGTGTFPIGFTLVFFAFLTNTLFILLIAGLLFWVELISSFAQMFSMRFLKRKLFKIAPIHHHFEAIGWPESKVVQRFWLFGIVMAVVALWVWGMVL